MAQRMAFLLGAIIVFAAALVFVGWILDIPRLKSIVPTWPEMAPITTVAFLLSAFSLGASLRFSRGKKFWLRASQICALAVITIGALKFCDGLLGWGLQFDLLGFHEPAGHVPARMSPMTALVFLLLGLALCLPRRAKFAYVFEFLVVAAGFVSSLGFFRYLYEDEPLWPFAQMAMHTGFLLILLSGAVFCTRTDSGLMTLLLGDSLGGMLARRLLPPTVLIPMAINYCESLAEGQGWFNPKAESSVFTATDIMIFGGLIGIAARLLHRTDMQRRQAEQAGTRLSAIVESSEDAIIGKNLDGTITSWNHGAEKLFGYTASEAVGRSMLMVFPPERVAEEREILARIGRGETVNHFETERITKYGRRIAVSVTISPVYREDGTIVGASKIARDITARKLAEARAVWLASFPERNPNPIVELSLTDNVLLYVNPAARQAFPDLETQKLQHPLLVGLPEILQHLKNERQDSLRREIQVADRFISQSISYIIEDERLRVYSTDVTQRNQALEALRDSEEKFRQLAENINEVFWMTDLVKQRMLYVSPAYEKIWGRSCESLYASPYEWAEAIHPGDRDRVLRAVAEKQTAGTYDEEYRIQRPDRSVRWIRDLAFPIRNAAGQIYRIVGTAEDITARKKMEEQFRQAQKMEGIGQLAGGVAHDFNNILAVIEMQSELMKTCGHLDTEQLESVNEIAATVQRASALTRQLLLFSRREVFQPRDLDLSETITSTTKMLKRILGETVQMETKLAAEPMLIHADAGMIDQVLLNLVVNARDAMPRGGQLIVETASVEFDEFAAAQSALMRPGLFVRLSVSDTGCGIPPENLQKIFEPFFTTKDVGKGTGLGLATVFGIVQQHQGWINVYSELGHGTTFRIYLPQLTRDVVLPENRSALSALPGGKETILLVEDDPALRASVYKALAQLGYRVLVAGSGPAAMDVWKTRHAEIHLLLTDLVMPNNMSGVDLARQLLQTRPGLKVIYMSGYSADVLGKDFSLIEGRNFLTKPFPAAKLFRAIREILDHDPAESRS